MSAQRIGRVSAGKQLFVTHSPPRAMYGVVFLWGFQSCITRNKNLRGVLSKTSHNERVNNN